jgi:hypothetical protein
VEVWLRTNARALWFGTVFPATLAMLGLLMAVGLPGSAPDVWVRGAGFLLALTGTIVTAALLVQMCRPRLAYRDRHLLVWLRRGEPIRLPIEYVECFWLGQAPSLLPLKRHAHSEASSVVVRLSDAAGVWRHQEVKPQLGTWCEGYITIRGTWCEPLDISLINRLNERLAEVSRAPAR